MRKTGLRIAAVVMGVLSGFGWMREKRADAQPQLGYGQAACVSSIPRAWGQYRGGSQQSGLAFEDSAGTLRFLTNVPCGSTPQVALELRRTPANAANGN